MIGRFIYNVLSWPYERGSWQWDVSCLIFLVVIFATPREFLEGHTMNPLGPTEIHEKLRAFLEGFWT